jgi:hypothetical protein
MLGIICEIKFRSFFFYRREKKKNNMIGLSIELRRRKSFIGRIKKIGERARARKKGYFFSFSLIDRERKETKAYQSEGSVDFFCDQRKLPLFLFSSSCEYREKKKIHILF